MKLLRYLLVQVFSYSLDMGSFLVFFQVLSQPLIVSNVGSKLISGIFAFFVHRIFTFANKSENLVSQGLLYMLLLALNIPVSSLVLSLVSKSVSSAVVAKFISDVLCVALSYWMTKQFVFNNPGKKSVKSLPGGER